MIVRKLANRTFLNSSSWVGVRTISGLFRLAILLAIARVYGPQQFGEVSLAISLFEVLRTFSEFGVDTVAIRKFAQSEVEDRVQDLGRFIGAKLLLATCFYILGALALLALRATSTEWLVGTVVSLSLFFVGVNGAISSYLQSSLSMSLVLKATAQSGTIALIFGAFAIGSHAHLIFAIASIPLGDGILLILLWRRLGSVTRVRIDPSETLSLLRESLPVGVMTGLIVLYFRIDNFFVYKLAGAAALGLYSAAFRLVEPVLMIPHSFSTTAYTVLSGREHQASNGAHVAQILVRSMWPAYIFVVGVALALLWQGRHFLALLSSDYLSVYPVICVLGITLIVRTVNLSLTAVLNSRGEYSVLARITAIDLAINIVLAFLLIPKWGIIGASFAALTTETVNAILQARSTFSTLSIPRLELANTYSDAK